MLIKVIKYLDIRFEIGSVQTDFTKSFNGPLEINEKVLPFTPFILSIFNAMKVL